MLQVLHDLQLYGDSREHQGRQWTQVERAQLLRLLPFWDSAELQRVCQSLCDKGIILIESPPLTHHQQLFFAMNEPGTAAPAPSPRASEPQAPGARLLAASWRPSEDLLSLLQLNHAIPREFALQQLDDFVLYWRDRQQASHAWPSKFRQHVLRQWRHHQSQQVLPASTSQALWSPSEEAMDILLRAQISPAFIEDAIPEFVLYWRERGEASGTWNSKFIAHIRRQWAKYNASVENDYEPRPIPDNWQPSEDVYDILRMANIDIDFARQLLPEFVLFWRDSQQAHRSWNTKFLQHAKHHWAKRHQMEQRHEGHPDNHQPGKAKDGSLIRRLGDRSWAKGLVDDI